MKVKKPVLLCILDGFGIAEANSSNAITQAKTPNLDYFYQNYPYIELQAAANAVGLPEGQMGNSEVGHLHIGAGRTIYQSLTLINKAIAEKTFFDNKAIKATIEHCKKYNSKLHIIGLLSDGGVHAHIAHMLALLEYCHQEQFANVYIHAILDGRDTKPQIAHSYLEQLATKIKALGIGTIASLHGRYYAMDRDHRWERLKKVYDILVKRTGASFLDPQTYVKSEYLAERSDEFIIPAYNQKVVNGFISENDSIIFANFRPDRAIQLASALTNNNYEWNLKYQEKIPKNLYFVAMMHYADSVKSNGIIFPTTVINNGLGAWVSKHNLAQLRIAETEKYAHVTYFFDGGKDVEYQNATRILIPSAKVATYNLQPKMSSYEITERLLIEIAKQKYDLIVLNFANPDMVGHTGDLKATIVAISAIDECLGKIYQAFKAINGILVISADHGNAEIMIDSSGEINKKHTSQNVPLIICEKTIKLLKTGTLANIAPTILQLLDIPIPEEMTALSLIAS